MSTSGKPNTSPPNKLCQHIDRGLTQEHLARVYREDEDIPILSIPFGVTWKIAWLTEGTVMALPNGKTTINIYFQPSPSLRKKARTTTRPHHLAHVGGTPRTTHTPPSQSNPT
jgi:hypothetical protein